MNLQLLLRLGRVSNLPTVWTNVLAATILSGATLVFNSVLWLCVVFSLYYVGGMFLNDAFDADFDREHRPERPIPQGEISRTLVFVLGGLLLALGLAGIAGHGLVFEGALRREPLMYGAALAVCIVWYNADHKRNFFGPVLMGLNRVYVYATTGFVVSSEPNVVLWYGAVALLSYLIGLTFLAQQENLTRLTRFWPAVFLFLPLGYPFFALASGEAEPNWSLVSVVIVLLLLWVGRALWLIRPSSSSPKIPLSIVSLIAGISLLDALGAALLDDGFSVMLCCAGFAVCLVSQKVVSGT